VLDWLEKPIEWLIRICGWSSIVGIIAIFVFIFWEAMPMIPKLDWWTFFTSSRWIPNPAPGNPASYGALGLIVGTFAVTGISLLIAVPVGLGAAVYISEFAKGKAKETLKIIIELLAGVPSVVYGLLGILLLRDWIYELFARFDPLSGDTLLTAGVLLAVMVLPTVVTLSDDALRSVPATQRRAARALGLTRGETVLHIALPQARRGLGAALLLALGRALGETIAVFLVVGRQDNHLPSQWLALRPLLESGQTLTSKLGSSETNIGYGDPLHWAAIVGLGLILFVLTGGLTVLATGFGKTSDA